MSTHTDGYDGYFDAFQRQWQASKPILLKHSYLVSNLESLLHNPVAMSDAQYKSAIKNMLDFINSNEFRFGGDSL